MKKYIVATVGVAILLIITLFEYFFLGDESFHKDLKPEAQIEAQIQPETEKVAQAASEDGNQAQTDKGGQSGQPVNETGTQTNEKHVQADNKDTDAVTMVFTGDVLFANSFTNSYSAGGISSVVSEDVLKELTGADLTMVNEEFPFSARGTQMPDKQYTFRADPSYAKALNELGVDIVSLANNHILDFGKDALSDTFHTLDGAKIKYAGAGESASRAKELQTFQFGDQTVGILAASRVIPVEGWNVDNSTPGVFTTYEGTAMCQEIAKAKKTCDFVVAYVHWGVEYQEYPQDYQRSLAKQYIDAGADAVIGGHTHCLQSIEYYNGKPIFYSLGNFIFGSQIDRSMAVEITLDPKQNGKDSAVSCRLIPVYASGGCTYQMDDPNAKSLYQYMEGISNGIQITDQGIVKNR